MSRNVALDILNGVYYLTCVNTIVLVHSDSAPESKAWHDYHCTSFASLLDFSKK